MLLDESDQERNRPKNQRTNKRQRDIFFAAAVDCCCLFGWPCHAEHVQMYAHNMYIVCIPGPPNRQIISGFRIFRGRPKTQLGSLDRTTDITACF